MSVFITDKIGLYLQDRLRKTNIRETVKFLKESENWGKEKLEEYKLLKLKELIEHLYKYNSFYHKLLDEYGIKPDDIQALTDIKKLPLLNKEMLRQQKDTLFSKIPKKYIKYGKTGGTTGVPLYVAKDTQTRSFGYGAYYRWFGWMGIQIGDPVVMLWGAGTVLRTSTKQKIADKFVKSLFNKLEINSFSLNEDSLSFYIKKILKHKPKLIAGYLSAILQLGTFLQKKQISIPSLIAVYTTTETLLPPYKKFLEEVYGVPVYDQYGCGECGSIAYECPSHQGLHINEEHVILEILDDSGNEIFDKPGRIAVTDLDNHVMPVIRYENGDVGILASANTCLKHPNYSLLKEIRGRSADTIILKDNSKVHGVFFTDIYDEINLFLDRDISRFQVYQKVPGEIEMRLESTNSISPEKISMLKDTLYEFFNKVEIIISPKLETDISGKFRYVISDVQKDKVLDK